MKILNKLSYIVFVIYIKWFDLFLIWRIFFFSWYVGLLYKCIYWLYFLILVVGLGKGINIILLVNFFGYLLFVYVLYVF